MQKLLIKGGTKLKGEVTISGAKNAALPSLCATLLADGVFKINHVPDLMDVRTMNKLLGNMGAETSRSGQTVTIDTTGINNLEAPYELVKTMRASVLVLGPLVARYGKGRVSLPGGCAIGARPINLHLMALELMGAKIKLEDGYVIASAKRLKGTRIPFDVPTVTGTENIMMAASLAKGTTLIENAAREPEISDLAKMLTSMGAKIQGAGQSVITIEGVDELSPVKHDVIPDRIECGTFIAAAAITGGDIIILGARPEHIDSMALKLKDTGIKITQTDKGMRIKGPGRLKAQDLITTPYPGFPTDMQAQFMALMTLASGTSVIQERIFENRFMHVAELKRMGANISVDSGVATVRGIKSLTGAEVMATDLRASASLIIAALAAKGTSTIHRIYHLDRGYDKIEKKLLKLGADIKRVK